MLSAALIFTTLPAAAGLFGSSWDEDIGKAAACVDAVAAQPESQAMAQKLVIQEPTLDQLSDRSIPTEAEAQEIRRGTAAVRPCRELTLAALRKHHPFLVSTFQLRFFQVDLVYVQLIQRRIAFGDANRLMQESWLEFRRNQEQYAQARADAERRAQAEAVDALMRQAHSAPPPPPGARRLNCRWIGPTLYCDAY